MWPSPGESAHANGLPKKQGARPLRFWREDAAPQVQVARTHCRSSISESIISSPSVTHPAMQNVSASTPMSNSPRTLLTPSFNGYPSPFRHDVLESLERIFRSSPNGQLSKRWREYHGCNYWSGLLSPLDPDLKAEIVKYGDLVQATYDAFDNKDSETRGHCIYKEQELLEKAGLSGTGYTVTKYIYATSDIHLLPKWMERSIGRSEGRHETAWIGFIAVATDAREIARLGRRDIVIVWRGTVTQCEWLEDVDGTMVQPGDSFMVDESLPSTSSSQQQKQKQQLHDGSHHHLDCEAVGVERGFLTLYTTRNGDAASTHGHLSACKQVRDELKRLMNLYKDEKDSELSITITGHSLGGALALMSAYDITEHSVVEKDVPVSVISFAAPRVGNAAFKARLEQAGVKVLRVVNTNDMVPKVPGILVHEESPLPGSSPSTQALARHDRHYSWSTYVHAGVELRLNNYFSPFLKKNVNMVGSHNLQLYLHLVDGYRSSSMPFVCVSAERHRQIKPFPSQIIGNKQHECSPHTREKIRVCMRFMKRDIALVNKESALLVDDLHVENNWHEKHIPKPSPRLSPLPPKKEPQRNHFNNFMRYLPQSHFEDISHSIFV
ncbi:hypothetical protein KP509_31G009100 [Ceratopteris richardii]|nr:hypothetical protein KP509_31G009100 [Ceratopteris richardii]